MDRQAELKRGVAGSSFITSATSVTWKEGRAFEQSLQRQREADRNCLTIHMNSLKPLAHTCSHSVTQKRSRDFSDPQGASAHNQGVGNLGTQSLLDGKGLCEIPFTAACMLASHRARVVCGFPEVDWGPLDNTRGAWIRTQQGQEGTLSIQAHAFPSRLPLQTS